MEIVNIAIDKLNPAEYNPRLDLQPGDKEYEDIKRSIVEFGLVEPLVINKGYVVVGGHQRLKVLRELNFTTIPCITVDLDKQKEKMLNIALNKIAGDWDRAKLKDILEELDTGEFDVSLTGFDEQEIEDLMTEFHVKPEEDDFDVDKAVEAVGEPICKRGDIWQLGKHFLMCGDATVEEDVEKLMDGEKVNLLLTDPPYGNLKITNKNGEVGGLSITKRKEYWKYGKVAKNKQYHKYANEGNFCFKPIWEYIKNWDCKKVIWGGNYFADILPITTSWICWDKRAGGTSWFSDFELAWTNLGMPARLISIMWQGMIREGESDKRVHPTQKPIELSCKIINMTDKCNNILDLFGGSGSTLIACEQLNRKCYMMEISELYCDVIIKRWENYTNKKVVKIS